MDLESVQRWSTNTNHHPSAMSSTGASSVLVCGCLTVTLPTIHHSLESYYIEGESSTCYECNVANRSPGSNPALYRMKPIIDW